MYSFIKVSCLLDSGKYSSRCHIFHFGGETIVRVAEICKNTRIRVIETLTQILQCDFDVCMI